MVQEIDREEMERLIAAGADLVDVREHEELEDGAIDGHKHMPLSEFDEFAEDVSKTKPTVFYCRSGRRSLKACELASDWTDQPLYSLRGGYLAYSGQEP